MSPSPSRRVAIPRRLTLRGRRWDVTLAARLPASDDAPGANRGVCEREKRRIWIDTTEPRETQERTLVHEVLHAIWPAGIVDVATEERLILGLEARLHEAIVSGALSSTTEGIG